MQELRLLDIDLTLFEDGGGAAPAGDMGAEAETEKPVVPESSRRARKAGARNNKETGGLDAVVYGKQEEEAAGSPDAGDGEQQLTPDERKAKFRELIDNEYKEEYAREFQEAFNRRFKSTKETEELLAKQQPVLEALMTKYKISDGDMGKLSEAIERDDSYWSAAAEEAGMSIDQYKTLTKLERENERFRRERQVSESQMMARRQMEAWDAQAREMSADYPDFDLATEVKNPQFMAMLRSGIPLRHAYEVAHLSDIKDNLKKTTAIETEKAVTDNLRARGARPTENGALSGGALQIKTDVTKLSKQDRAEIARRVQRGEEIRF